MTDIVKTVRVSMEDDGVFLDWYQSHLGLRTFSETFRYLLRQTQNNLAPTQDKSYRLYLRDLRIAAADERCSHVVKDPTHCGGCGKGDPWFTWYPSYEGSDEVGRCQGCSYKTYRDAVA